ncbi:MAG: leucine-rich repeat domain-containing protein [Oscillospiraceae bacterium]|nr:leucine-rich repeat domain-containing protein [Oscillospiraceae bacterium]MBQ7130599.1 leucine-rich repeat domain-containing protein [Oscillospiraceae bacterium]
MSRNNIKLNISRLLALLLAMTLLFAAAPVAFAAESGTCGENLSWTFSDGTLTITGSGAMKDYSEHSMPPWYSFRNQILYLSLPAGLTRVGDLAFYDCVNLTAVSLPASVTAVGKMAFCQNSSVTMLSLNHGLKHIGRSAFELCESLVDLRIPGTVETIERRAFYRCTALKYVTVPSSVTTMGTSVFSYCDNLLKVEVDASIDGIPANTFYGCDNLNSVKVAGIPVDVEEAKNTTESSRPTQLPNTPENAAVPSGGNAAPGSSNTAVNVEVTQDESGNSSLGTTSTTKTDNATVTQNVTTENIDGEASTQTEVVATVVTPEGWDEVAQQVEQAQNRQDADSGETIDVTVYVPIDPAIPENVLSGLAGDNVVLNVQTQAGSKYTIDCSELTQDDIKGDFVLTYTIVTAQTIPEELEGLVVYSLHFENSIGINAEVMVRIPGDNARHKASLYQFASDGMLMHLQSVVVDDGNMAHFYLSAADEETAYLIAMDVPGKEAEQAIVPVSLYDDYKLIDQATGKQYVITGRTSSWGMGLGTVMTILAVVMVSMIVIVGFVMYAWNKRRLKMGYVPDLSEEDYE